MNPAIWLCFLPILIVLLTQAREEKTAILYKIRKNIRRDLFVLEMIEKYIGKECLIYTVSSSTQVAGTIVSVKDNWVEVDSKGTVQVVNADYIVRVREYPRNKSGKKKSVVID